MYSFDINELKQQLKGGTKLDNILIDTKEELEILDAIPHYVPVSAHLEWNLDGLIEKCWEYLDLLRFNIYDRVYTKPKG